MAYWRLASGIEVDFIVNHIDVAIEAKATAAVRRDHLKGLRQLQVEHPETSAQVVVCLEAKARRSEDGIEILPAQDFIEALWQGRWF